MIPREVPIFDALVPSLLLVFVTSIALSWVIDWAMTKWNLYPWVWYRSLFRFACFVCVFAAGGLWIY